MVETSVTLISTNLNKGLINNYKDYKLIEESFTYEELFNAKKVIFYNVLNNIKEEEINKLIEYLNANEIKYVIFTNDLEISLYTDYLYVYDDKNILVEGPTKEVYKNDKLLKRLGFKLPFMIDLSLLLKEYNLINKIYIDKESLKSDLWK